MDEVNLLDDNLVDVVLDSAAGGINTVEREGVSISHPAKFILVGSGNPAEGEMRPQLLDRFGMSVNVGSLKDAEERIAMVRYNLQSGMQVVQTTCILFVSISALVYYLVIFLITSWSIAVCCGASGWTVLQPRLHTRSVTLNQILCGGESWLLPATSEKHACQACMHVDGKAEVKASRQRRCAIMMRQRRCALSWRASPECHTSMYGIYVWVTRPCTVSLQHSRCSAADCVQIYAVLALLYGMIDFLSLSQPSTSPGRNNLSEHRNW